MRLCLGGILDRVLIAQGCFATAEQCLYRQGLLSPLPTPPARRLGLCKQLGGYQSGQLTPTVPRDIPHQIASCSAYKAGEKEQGNTWNDFICLP